MPKYLPLCYWIDWPHVGRVLSASIAPVVAVVVAYIAAAQYLINRRQYRLALFEKRMAVFNSTMNIIGSVLRSATDYDFPALRKQAGLHSGMPI